MAEAMMMAAALFAPVPALARDGQPEVDRLDPSVAVEETVQGELQRPPARERPDLSSEAAEDAALPAQAVLAGAIRVEGATMLPPAAFAGAIEPCLGRELSPEELRALVRAVADVARRAGFGLATATIPPQSLVNGVLRVRLDEGRIDAIDARGPAAEIVRARLAGLAGEAPLRTAALEHRLLTAGDIAGVTVARARLVRTGGRNVLRVETRRERVEGRLTIDNWGTSSLGPVRMRVVADINGVLGRTDRLTLGGSITPFEPGEFRFVQAGYTLPVTNTGTELAVRGYFSTSAAGGALREREIDGGGHEIEGGISHPLMRGRGASLWGYLFAGVRDSNLDLGGVRVRDERIAWASATLYGWTRIGQGALRTRMSLVQGLDALDATRQGDPLASRRDGDGVFTKLSLWTDLTLRLGGNVSLQLSQQAQLASRPLLSSEETGLGGRAFLRGYDYREFSGDEGGAAAAELRYDIARPAAFLRRAQLYVYADAGRVTNLRGGFGSGSLASAGGGLRLSFPKRIDAGLELGIPLRDGFDGTRPDPRLSFTVAARF